MTPGMRNRLLVALYGFGIALVLSLGAGALVGWASSSASASSENAVASAEARATSAEQQAAEEKARADALDARLVELTQDGAGTAPDPAPDPAPNPAPNPNPVANPQFKVRAVQRENKPLDQALLAQLKVSYSVDRSVVNNGIALANGAVDIPRPAQGVVNICLAHPLEWRVIPDHHARQAGFTGNKKGVVECLTPPSVDPGLDVALDFVLEPAT